MEIALQLRYVLGCQSTVSFLRPNYIINYSLTFSNKIMALEITFFCGTLILRMEIASQLCFFFARHCEVFFITSQLHYLFVPCSYVFYDVRITSCFGRFELRIEVTLQLRFVFVRYCDTLFIMSYLRYLFVRCSYVF